MPNKWGACLLMTLALVRPGCAANTLANPRYATDGLKQIAGASALLSGAKSENVQPARKSGGLELKPGAASGTVVLAPVRTDFEFNELIPSWNGHAPADGGFRVWMRAGSADWMSPWFEAGTWGRLGDEPTTRGAVFPGGHYDVDYLKLDRPANTVEIRVDLVRNGARGESPSLSAITLSYTNSTGNAKVFRKFGRPQSGKAPSVAPDQLLDVPFRSQVVPTKTWIGRICSPASVSMATAYFGSPATTQEVAAMLYDPPSDLFGVWHRSVQGAAQLGVNGYLRRFRNWEDVQAEIRRGSVICASIRFRLGELRQPPRVYQRRGTEGHIVVVKGFAPGGRVVTHDSASKDYGPNESWLAEDLARAWFDKGGVAYVFVPPARR